MPQATFDLPEQVLTQLSEVAQERGWSTSEVVLLALRGLLEAERLPTDEWIDEWRALQKSVAADRMQPVSEQTIDAEIDLATDEVWAERRAARGR